MARLRRPNRLRKQSIYRAIESDIAREEEAKKSPVVACPPAPVVRDDDRDPIEIARAANSALRGKQ